MLSMTEAERRTFSRRAGRKALYNILVQCTDERARVHRVESGLHKHRFGRNENCCSPVCSTFQGLPQQGETYFYTVLLGPHSRAIPWIFLALFLSSRLKHLNYAPRLL